MMEVVLTRLRDFSCKTSTFNDCKPAGQSACRDPQSRADCLSEGCTAGEEGKKLDIESALAWLRRELMEMRSQDQALIRQLMELHSGIQELKQELSEEEQEEETDEEEAVEEEEGSYWDSESEQGSSSVYSSSGEFFFNSDSTELVLAGAGALVFCGFIIYDTNLLMKQLSPEEHILASINLYLDIVNLFLHILRLLDSMKKH